MDHEDLKPTTPKRIADVAAFCKTINPTIRPFRLATKPEEWSRDSCCHLNVKRYIQEHGGIMVCGYRIWYAEDLYIQAERHAVWKSDRGNYRDVSFSSDGATSIVFFPDVPDKRDSLDQNEPTIYHFLDPQLEPWRPILAQCAEITQVMDDDTAWRTCLTYADFKRTRP